VVALCEGLPWKTCMQVQFKDPGHINYLEAMGRRALLRRAPCDVRLPILQDSSVSISSASKGRSGSGLNRILVSELPWVVGKGKYPAYLHAPYLVPAGG
jgi:hypothetical protein